MSRLAKRVAKKEEGQILILFALTIVAIMGFVALIVDGGIIQMTRENMQIACDAAALAGAQVLPDAGTAVSTAKNFASLNGADPSNTVVTTPYNGDANKIEVVCTEDVQFSFAAVLGFTEGDISARAVAQKMGMAGGPFGYTLFSGDPNFTLTLNGSHTTIGGSAHSNADFVMNGSHQTITKSVEALPRITINGSHITVSHIAQAEQIVTHGSDLNIGEKVFSAAPWIDMPDFSDMIQAEAETAGQAYSGNKTYNGVYLTVDDPIYVDGNLTVNGSHFTGKGVVLVSGDITLNGSNLSSTGSSICFYSESGNITINGSHIELDGLVYAPTGSIIMNGSHQTINGRVIGNRIVLNGSHYEIISGSDDLDFLPATGVSLVE